LKRATKRPIGPVGSRSKLIKQAEHQLGLHGGRPITPKRAVMRDGGIIVPPKQNSRNWLKVNRYLE
jgi:hypothetical protein